MPSRRYKPLRDYGLIGDMHTAALVGRDGSVDWWCLPRFDSPSVFGRILDDRTGGFCSVAPAGFDLESSLWESAQRYRPETNVLVTEFSAPDARLRITDFMPVRNPAREADRNAELHRKVEAEGGPVEVEVRFAPRFDYARRSPEFRRRRHGVLATDREGEVLTLAAEPGLELALDGRRDEATARFTVEPGGMRWLVLRHDDDEVRPLQAYRGPRKLRRTARFWREWAAELRYEGEHRDLVVRSALVLKLLCYAPTGAVVAAPTTSLPETVGGGRNWDYRYTWLRDAAYTLFGLTSLGKYEEVDRFMDYLKRILRRERWEHLQIMYGVGGETEIAERELPHLHGYRGSRPVRVGNAAAEQVQLDAYGVALDAIHVWRKRHPMTEGTWEAVRKLADRVVEHWRAPDHGPWEVRAEPRQFVFSKLLCWVALDRAAQAADEVDEATAGGDDTAAAARRWRKARDEIRETILERGWCEARQTFVQHFDTDRTDATCLLVPLVRFLPPDDPRVVSTVERVQEELGHPSGLVFRYRDAAGRSSPMDGEAGEEGAFCMNGFQMVQALAMMGRHREAEERFERLVDYASPLGLLSEEVDPESGELLGNFPQAFSHIALINAAHVLARTRPEEGATEPMLRV